jgi:hypothetical protein
VPQSEDRVIFHWAPEKYDFHLANFCVRLTTTTTTTGEKNLTEKLLLLRDERADELTSSAFNAALSLYYLRPSLVSIVLTLHHKRYEEPFKFLGVLKRS